MKQNFLIHIVIVQVLVINIESKNLNTVTYPKKSTSTNPRSIRELPEASPMSEIAKDMQKIKEVLLKYSELITPEQNQTKTNTSDPEEICDELNKKPSKPHDLRSMDLQTLDSSTSTVDPQSDIQQQLSVFSQRLENILQSSVPKHETRLSSEYELDYNGTQDTELNGNTFIKDKVVNITLLKIAHNKELVSIRNDTFDLKFSGLLKLVIRWNKIERIDPFTFDGGLYLQSLKILNLANNKISVLPAYSFINLVNLRELYLHNNQFQTLENKVFYKLPKLEKLHIFATPLETIMPEAFVQVTKLRDLTLHYNRISRIEPSTFAKLPSLENLDLSGNRISTLSKSSFEQLTNLETLDLSDNQISNIALKAFIGLIKLQELFLNRNEIKEFSVELIQPTANLLKLDISDNQISALDPEFLIIFAPHLEWIDLTENLLPCSMLNVILKIFESKDVQYVKSCAFTPERHDQCTGSKNVTHGVYCRNVDPPKGVWVVRTMDFMKKYMLR